ncbi:acylphosphatase [Nocardia sp. NPDC056000]|uniref:acylphosphatase n=1 Tax=Nocardia sp. NPDC056000 TaxID=3345674 RepID=UPI0035D765C6
MGSVETQRHWIQEIAERHGLTLCRNEFDANDWWLDDGVEVVASGTLESIGAFLRADDGRTHREQAG